MDCNRKQEGTCLLSPTAKTWHGSPDCFTRKYAEIYINKSQIFKFFKRLFDIVTSAMALIILAPLFLITAILILLEDGRPIFYSQLRAGKNSRKFNCYKFRSMVENADSLFSEMQKFNEKSGPVFKIQNDPRITRIGKIIRKYSIDELPQFINIIKGDMSIVGPRPIMAHQMDQCSEYDQQRLIVYPGLTCYWQIGGRYYIDWDAWMALDLKYIEKMSIIEDFKIIFKTIPVVLKGDGAF